MDSSLCESIPISVSGVVKEGVMPCPAYISIVSQKLEKLEYLIFQNYYVSSISILQQTREGKWVSILSDFRLTNFPHFENDAENWYIIPSSFFNENFIPSYFKELRISLSQPSPNWKNFNLKNISCYTIKEKPVQKKNEPVNAFYKLKSQIQEKLETLSSAAGSDIISYEESLSGIVEISRLEVSQL